MKVIVNQPRLLHYFLEKKRLAIARFRSWKFMLLGADVAGKCLLGRGTRIDRPWCVDIGCRVQFEEDVWLKIVSETARLSIGEYSFLGRGVEIDVNEQVKIGEHVMIAPSVFITDHGHNFQEGKLVGSQGCTSHAVIIGDDVWLGAQSVVLPGVRIGHGAVVGAGAVVTRDVPDNAIVAGVPARVLRFRV